MIVKITILRLLGSSDDKEKIGVARPETNNSQAFRSKDSKIEETVKKSSQNEQDRDNLLSPVKPMISHLYSSVQWTQKAEARVLRRMNRRCLKTSIGAVVQRLRFLGVF